MYAAQERITINKNNYLSKSIKEENAILLKTIVLQKKEKKYFNKRVIFRIILMIIFSIQILIIIYKNGKIKFLEREIKELEYKLKEIKRIYENNDIKYIRKNKEFEDYEKKMEVLKNEIISNQIVLEKKEKYYQEIIKSYNKSSYNEMKQKQNFTNLFMKKIKEIYEKEGCVNLNELESIFPQGREWPKEKDKINEINVGSSIEPNYILRAMMTITSLIDSQKNEVYLRIHFSVVNNFTVSHMMKIYSLRDKTNKKIEFNFYNAKRVEKELRGQANSKGNGIMAKVLLPQLLKNDIEKIIIIDVGDLLVLRDLSEMYNWNMNNYSYLGVPDQMMGRIGEIHKKPLTTYINTGSYLINVTKVKMENMYGKIIKERNAYFNSLIADQDLINDIAYGKIGYLPIKFGAYPLFKNDNLSNEVQSNNMYEQWNFYSKIIESDAKYPDNLRNEIDLYLQAYNPVIVHQFDGKWMKGEGMSIYRRIVQYYIKYAGIWEELCQIFPGYCQI